tara:strand:- start:1181 stop:1336 length:156 start_codon:yes stop_codon:yes gene_type:complete
MTIQPYYMQQGGQRAQMEPPKRKLAGFGNEEAPSAHHHIAKFFEGSPKIKA